MPKVMPTDCDPTDADMRGEEVGEWVDGTESLEVTSDDDEQEGARNSPAYHMREAAPNEKRRGTFDFPDDDEVKATTSVRYGGGKHSRTYGIRHLGKSGFEYDDGYSFDEHEEIGNAEEEETRNTGVGERNREKGRGGDWEHESRRMDCGRREDWMSRTQYKGVKRKAFEGLHCPGYNCSAPTQAKHGFVRHYRENHPGIGTEHVYNNLIQCTLTEQRDHPHQSRSLEVANRVTYICRCVQTECRYQSYGLLA